MKRILTRTLLIMLCAGFFPGTAYALGLGELELKSALNQPLEARVKLLAATAEELDSLKIGLANNDAFKRAGIQRLFLLSKLRFEVQRPETGADYLRIFSTEPIREPFLNFLVEAGWSTGRLFREYTVLLDPPLYDPNARKRAARDTARPKPAQPTEPSQTDNTGSSIDASGTGTVSYSGDEYGPTVATDTLWSIASATRPDSSVSVQQMMLALLRANPGAFIDNNINGLKRGQILAIPSSIDELKTISNSAAFAEAKLQNAAWQETRGAIADETPQRADTVAIEDSSSVEDSSVDETDSAVMADEQPVDSDVADADPELTLVAASTTDIDNASGQGTNASGSINSEDLVLANEELVILSSENNELKEQLTDAEVIIEDLKRLITLQDDELNAMRNQVSGATDAVSVEAETETETETDAMGADAVDETEVDVVDEEGEFVEEVGEAPAPVDAAETDAMAVDVVDETAVEEVVEEEVAEEEVDVVEEEVEGEFVEEVSEAAAAPAAESMVDKVLAIVKDYLVMILGVLGGIILLVVVALFLKKRNAAASEAEAVKLDFSDFDDAEANTDIADPTLGGIDEQSDAFDVVDEAPVAESVEEPEEDPLSEVNVFLAYEHFDQAEEFVRNAIKGDPDNLDFHAKLLEVFYAANNKKSYEEAAQVLHDKVNGGGEHWEMAVAMWQEISPNRALFAEPIAGEDDAAASDEDTTGGIVDLTAGDSESDSAAAEQSMDFDIGGDTGDAEPAFELPSESTAASTDEDVLDVTSAMDSDSSDQDLLDVTAAVGLDDNAEEEDIIDLPSDPAVDEDALDISADSQASEDILDFPSATGEEGLLDVTAHSEVDDEQEDLLDVTAAGQVEDYDEQAGSESLDLPADDGNTVNLAADGSGMDFDIGTMETEDSAAEEVSELVEEPGDDDGHSVDFDIGGLSMDEPDSSETDFADADLDMGMDAGEVSLDDSGGLGMDAGEVSLDDSGGLGMDAGEVSLDDSGGLGMDAGEVSLDDSGGLGMDAGEVSLDDSGGLGMDAGEVSLDDSGDLDISMDDADASLDMGLSSDEDSEDLTAEFDLTLDDDDVDDALDMDGTVEIPSMGLSIDDDDEDSSTVFVSRSDEDEQEDGITTQLDLAKAYVELGDEESATSILDDVMTDGNAEQQKVAKDLLDQL